MKKVLVISAHLDDAVLSAGQFIAGRGGDVDILTVFSGIPNSHTLLTEYDKSCGFNNSKDAMVVRKEEDKEACAILNATPFHTNFLDSQYSKVDLKLVNTMFKGIDVNDYEMILAPLGLRHPDHELISDSALSAFKLSTKLYLYEDLPHRVTHPELVYQRLHILELTGYDLEPAFIGDGPIADKVRALWCYRTQMNRGDLNPYNLYVPERFWKV